MLRLSQFLTRRYAPTALLAGSVLLFVSTYIGALAPAHAADPPPSMTGAPQTPTTIIRYSYPLKSDAPAILTTLPDGVFTGPRSALLKQDLSVMEQKTYGRPYEDQSVLTRVKRLEQSLLGGAQPGKLQDRLTRLTRLVNRQAQSEAAGDQMKMVDYLEQRLFQMVYDQEPVENRVARLEMHTFGRSNPTQPWQTRLEKLTYTIPLMVKGVKLSKSGTVIASTRQTTPRPGSETLKNAPLLTPIDVSAGGVALATKRQAPDGTAISMGDYFHNINKPTPNQMLRWTELPVKVFNLGSTPEEAVVLSRALQAWQRTFPVQAVSEENEADVLVNFSASTAADGILIRPATRLSAGPAGSQTIRTVISVNLSPARPLQNEYQMHLVMHAVGHALGLWGHSDDPQDVMYPVLPQEQVDIPPRWLRRSYLPMVLRSNVGIAPTPLPTSRDSNTLTKVYDTPAMDLSKMSSL